jgi:hypothetical protein
MLWSAPKASMSMSHKQRPKSTRSDNQGTSSQQLARANSVKSSTIYF